MTKREVHYINSNIVFKLPKMLLYSRSEDNKGT